MLTLFDTTTWNRRSTYEFFKNYDDPFFNITATVDVTTLQRRCMEEKGSFFIESLYCSLRAANETEAFRLRLADDRVLLYDTIHAGATVLLTDETFRFCYFDYRPEREQFIAEAQVCIEQAINSPALDPRDEAIDLIHYSVIPWVSFTGFKHARRWIKGDSVPKIVFGKYFASGDRLLMPVSVEVHHALMDGLHAGRFFGRFQQVLEEG